MKKIVIFAIIILSMSMTVYAGNVPEELLNYDGAQIFFGEVTDISSSPNGMEQVEVLPWKVIKGDVNKDPLKRIVYTNVNIVGDFDVKKGESYLFTFFDENNPADVFEVSSYDTSALKLKNVTGDMWERFEKYLNEGRYTDAEHERIDRKNAEIPVGGAEISFEELLGVSAEAAEEVSIHYYGNVYEIAPEEFYKAIGDIVLTDIEDVSLEKRDGNSFSISNGMYITVNGFDGYAFVTDDCKVDRYGMHYSRLPIGAYTIKTADYAKLRQFVSEADVLPVVETPLAGKMTRWLVLVLLVFLAAYVIGFAVKKKRG